MRRLADRWLARAQPAPDACLGCGEPLELQTFGVCQASVGDVAVVLHGLPFRACRSGCFDRRFADPAFIELLHAAIWGGGALPVARGGAGEDPRCGRCVSRQWAPGTRRATIGGSFQVGDAPEFDLAVTAPTRECANCGLRQLMPGPEVAADLAAALARSFEAGHLRTGFRR